jgi:hypothetical protein
MKQQRRSPQLSKKKLKASVEEDSELTRKLLSVQVHSSSSSLLSLNVSTTAMAMESSDYENSHTCNTTSRLQTVSENSHPPFTLYITTKKGLRGLNISVK